MREKKNIQKSLIRIVNFKNKQARNFSSDSLDTKLPDDGRE